MVSAVIQASFLELTPVFLTCNFFGSFFCTARYVLSSLKISYGETKFREEVGHLHFVLLRGARMFEFTIASSVASCITGVVFIFV